MYLIEIHLWREIYNLVYRSSIAFFLERDEIILHFRFDPLSGDDKPVILYIEFQGLFLDTSQRQQNDNLLGRFVDIIWYTRHLLCLLHSGNYNVKYVISY